MAKHLLSSPTLFVSIHVTHFCLFLGRYQSSEIRTEKAAEKFDEKGSKETKVDREKTIIKTW